MSYHSPRTLSDDVEVTDALVQELANGLRQNREYNKQTGQGDVWMGVYGTFTTADAFLFSVGRFLDYWQNRTMPKEVLEQWVEGAPSENLRELARRIILLLHPQMNWS